MALILHPTAAVNLDDDDAPSNYTHGGGAAARVVPFAGLSNQGATCYMNSLLQTLYMTPEFRRAIYSWRYDSEKDGKEEDCIPLQLQRLFGSLQMSKQRAVETRALTRSFGWEGSEVFQQHDVQELCRVLFDALEQTFKNTPHENLIDRLYAGQLIDYIKCKGVNYQSERDDKFLDASLVIHPFGTNKINHSLDDCLRYFLKPEILDGENKYYCEQFQRKVDAIKGLKFKRLPYIFTMQLKRFDYDPRTFNRIKLNDQVRFPLILDMNKYVSKLTPTINSDEGGEYAERMLQKEVERLWAEAKNLENTTSELDGILDDVEFDEAIPDLVDINGTKSPDQILEESKKFVEEEDINPQIAIACNGEWVYELYAVLVHSGSALGGHYYAYIKDLDTKKWYNFNDSSVSEISSSMFKEAWGGKQRSYSNLTYSSNSGANAYMLMYRKVDPSSNETLPADELVPDYIVADVAKLEEERKRQREEADERRARLTLKVFYKGKENTVEASKRDKYIVLLRKIRTELDVTYDSEQAQMLENEQEALEEKDSVADDNPQSAPMIAPSGALKTRSPVALENMRLRAWSSYQGMAQMPYNFLEYRNKTLGDIPFHDYKSLCVEVKTPSEEWPTYDPEGFYLFIIEYDPESDEFKPQRNVRMAKDATLSHLRREVAQFTSYPAEQLRFVHTITTSWNDSRAVFLEGESKRLKLDLNLYEAHRIFVEPILEPDEESRAMALHIRQINSMSIKIIEQGQGTESKSLTVDKRWTVSKLRSEIAKLCDLPEDSFRILRNSNNGQELKNPDQTLGLASVYMNCILFVAHGRPLKSNTYWLKLFIASPEYEPGVRLLPQVTESDMKDLKDRLAHPETACAGMEPDEPNVDTVSAEVLTLALALQDVEIAESRTHTNTGQAITVNDDVDVEETGSTEAQGDGDTDGNADDDDADKLTEEFALYDVDLDPSTEKTPEVTGSVTIDMDVGTNENDEVETTKTDNDDTGEFGSKKVICSYSTDRVEYVGEVVAANSTTGAELRSQALDILLKQNKVAPDFPLSRVRVRDKQGFKMSTKILRDELTLAQMAVPVYDGREIVVQLLPSPQTLPPYLEGDVVVCVQRWHRSTWTLGKKQEVMINAGQAMNQFGYGIAKMFGIDPIHLRVLLVMTFNEPHLHKLHLPMPVQRPWVEPCKETRTLKAFQWFLTDGEVMIIQDASEPLRELNPKEQASVARVSSTGYGYKTAAYTYGYPVVSVSSSKTSYGGTYRSKEQGIKIKTRQDRIREAQAKDAIDAGGEHTDTETKADIYTPETTHNTGLALFDDVN